MILFVDVIILLLWQMSDPEKAVEEESGTPDVFDTVCKSDGSVSQLNIVYKAVLTIYGCYVSFLTRDYKSAIAESKQILFCMYVIIVMAVLVGIVMSLESTVVTVVTIQAVATVLGSITLCSLLMFPKFLMRNMTREDLLSGGVSNTATNTGSNTKTGGGSVGTSNTIEEVASSGSGSARIEELEQENELLKELVEDYRMQLGLDENEVVGKKKNEIR
mmetsp:Transcript_12271/g.24346  ORF Transcript_12271/g.24346 Transcript_12271/m.24346 type:complete len:218 (-) Transcript_12271:18-671(-)